MSTERRQFQCGLVQEAVLKAPSCVIRLSVLAWIMDVMFRPPGRFFLGPRQASTESYASDSEDGLRTSGQKGT